MIEYTMARIVLITCGVLMLSALVPPVTALFEDGESAEMQDQSESLCRMLDSFIGSDASEMTFFLRTVLPQNSSVSMDGYFITIIDGEKTYTYNTDCIIESDKDIYTSNDYVRLTKDNGTITVTML